MLTVSISYESLTAVTGIVAALVAIYLIVGHYYENRGTK